MSSFEKFKEKLLSLEMFHSSLTGNKAVIKKISMFLRLGIDLK